MKEKKDSNKEKKKEKDKKEKRMVTYKLFKNINDEEFLTSSEEFDESLSFPHEMIHISEIIQKVDKINILSTNKQIIYKNISSTSSSNKFKDINNKKEEEKEIEQEEYNKDKLSITQNNIIYYDEKDIEDSKDNNDIENIIINTSNNNHNNDNNDSFSVNDKRDEKMSKLNLINKSNLFTSDKGIPSSINLLLNNNSKKNIVNNISNQEDEKSENISNNNSNNNESSSISSSKSRNSNSNSNSDINSILNNYKKNNLLKNDKEQIHVNKSKKSFFSLHSNKNTFDNVDSEISIKSMNNKNKTQNQCNKNINFNLEPNSPFQSQGEEGNDKNIINLKPINNVVKTFKNKEEICAAETIVNENTNCKLGESEEKVQKNIKPENRLTKSKLPTRRFSLNSNNTSNINNFNKKKQEENQISFATWIEKKLINLPLLILVSILYLFSLFSSDVNHIWLSTIFDLYFDIANFIILIYLIIEIILVCILDEFYLNNFVFWIDVLGAISVLFDIEKFMALVLGYELIDKNFEKKKFANSVEYLVICVMMLGRAIRASKIFRILKIYNLINTKKKFKDIYTEMQKRDIVTEEQNKQKLIQKIQILEASENESDESSSSENSFHNSDEESNIIKDSPIMKRSKTIAENKFNLQAEQEISKDLKNISVCKRKSKIFQRKSSLRFMRQNSSIRFNISGRNSVANIENSHISNYVEMDEKKIEEEKKLKKKREEEVYEKMDEAIKNTKITSKVNNSVRKKLIFFLVIILIVCIILSEEIFSNFKDDISSYKYLFEPILYYSSHNDSSKDKIKNFLSSINENDFPVINITENDILIYENEHLERQNLRYTELIKISLNRDTNEVISIVYSKKKDSNLKHILLFLGTLLVCLSLFLSSIFFEKDLTNILLSPIEVMIVIANKVANDPMNAKDIEDLEQDIISMLPQRNKTVNKNEKDEIELNQNYYESYNCYEVHAIMTAIIKISALLAMSVGEAGGEIIHKNLSSHHELHLHSRGKRKSAIFGFCNIRNFKEINLALEEETIPLINKIAEIVHSSVDRFRGSTNKNIGNTFLNVWKFYNNINMKNGNNVIKVKKDNLLEIDPINPQIGITADCAVLAYLRCILKINKNRNILEYRKNKILKGIIPNFKIDMGFGLHLGYGIEGPVGSIFKIEVSYLSPNVNIASRLETATKQFGVNLLISGNLYNLFTEEMKGICRYVDCVTVKGSSEPINLYTIDINCKVTKQKAEKIRIIKDQKEKEKIFKEKKIMLENLIEQYGSVCSIILDKESYMELLDEKSEEFYDAWGVAIELYRKGKWTEAKKYFEECIKEDPNDGPSNTLYNYIKKFNFESPKNWKGERELTSK